MKFGVITDIHNNIIALKAVVEKLQQLQCDRIVCCGDIIGIGPCPEETVQYLMQIPDLIAVRGNHEKYLFDEMPTEYPNEENMGYEEMQHHQWEHSLLSKESVDFLKSLPYKVNFKCEGYTLSVMHYCMDYDGHYKVGKMNPTKRDLIKMFADVEADIVLYGHNHNRNICKGDKFYINVGSLGCPAQDKNIARAGIVNIQNSNFEFLPIDLEYDAEEVIRAIDEINYPDADNIKKYFYGI
ncbi:MAG: metallophosphoesterase family protein [Clostridia bacterium]|nr:metallophosphoesterase family protein [Clostridia bacterium]